MAKYNDDDIIWRTIGGRRIPIRKGQSLSEAMKESGKFKKSKTEVKDEQKKFKDSEKDKLIDSDMTSEELDKTAQWLYDNDRDEWNKFTDNELKELAKKCQITKDNPGGRAYDDEVFEEMEKRGLSLNDSKKEMTFKEASENQLKRLNEYEDAYDAYDKAMTRANEKNSDKEFHFAGEELYSDDPNRFGDKLRKYNEKMNPSKDSDYGLSEKQKEAGERLNKNAENGIREDFNQVLSGKQTYDGEPKELARELSNEWGINLKRTEEILNEETKKYLNNKESKSRDDIVKQLDNEAGEVKNNKIPRDFEKGYGKFKVKTTAGDNLDDRYEITKDEYGQYHAKNLRTGETYQTFADHLRNGNVFEFEDSKSSANNWKSEEGGVTRRETDKGTNYIQGTKKADGTSEYTRTDYDKKGNEVSSKTYKSLDEAKSGDSDWRSSKDNESIEESMKRVANQYEKDKAEGKIGQRLVENKLNETRIRNEAQKYYEKLSEKDIAQDLEERKNRLDNDFYDKKDKEMYQKFYDEGKKYYDEKYGKDKYKSSSINDNIRRKAYQKYLKEHPNSKMKFEEFKDMRKQ